MDSVWPDEIITNTIVTTKASPVGNHLVTHKEIWGADERNLDG